jgi:hypothetical protein
MACTDVPVELGNMSPHLAEAMLVVEDMPILKRKNVMVGITRSKVFFFRGVGQPPARMSWWGLLEESNFFCRPIHWEPSLLSKKNQVA